jgi:hypothetical protein
MNKVLINGAPRKQTTRQIQLPFSFGPVNFAYTLKEQTREENIF